MLVSEKKEKPKKLLESKNEKQITKLIQDTGPVIRTRTPATVLRSARFFNHANEYEDRAPFSPAKVRLIIGLRRL